MAINVITIHIHTHNHASVSLKYNFCNLFSETKACNA